MSDKKLEDYLNEGIYGPKELKPDEKRKYLGTYRERVLLALYKKDIYRKRGIKEITALKETYPDAIMLLNDKMNINILRPYRQLAMDLNFSYTYVRNETTDTEYGLIIALEYAIDKEDIHLPEKVEDNIHTDEPNKKKVSWWKRLFGYQKQSKKRFSP